MIKKSIEDAINSQINAEMYSSYLYLSMSAYFETKNLKGFANWMKIQAQEEMVHALKFYDFINTRGGKVNLLPIAGPEVDWESPLAAFEAAYNHEQFVTDRINKLVSLAIAESDHATNSFLQWFVNEQVEEEASVSDVVEQLKIIGKDGSGLFFMDKELAQRVFVPPAATQNA